MWVNGRLLGSAPGGTQADSDTNTRDPGPGEFAIPAGLVKKGEKATISVLVQNMGHNDDWIADDNRMRQPRGLVGADVIGSDAPIAWKIQGARGGEDLADRTRGPLNNGGLFGERAGWSLPGFPDHAWSRPGSAGDSVPAGVSWRRTSFKLDLPKRQDVSAALRFVAKPSDDYRLVFFLNGWNLGQYGADIGPQTDFVLPAGVLRTNGENTLAVAVIAEKASKLSPMSLVALSNHRGGVPVRNVASPGYQPPHPG